MKLRTRGFSMILIGIIILNFISKVYASEVKELTLTKDITDAIGDIEYGETASEYIFDVDVLSGQQNILICTIVGDLIPHSEIRRRIQLKINIIPRKSMLNC